MSFWKSFVNKSRKSLKYSVTDPQSFQEVWSFTSTRIRVVSLLLLLIVGLGVGTSYLISLFGGSGIGQNDTSIERKKLEQQHERIEVLLERVKQQEQYIAAVKRILSGEVPISSDMDSLADVTTVDYGSLTAKPSKSEKRISEKVKADMRTNAPKEEAIPIFKPPVFGVVSDGFDKKTHPGIDVVTDKNESIKACLSGTVVYTGFTRMDGYILILDHGNGYMSVYKHALKSLKKIGSKVQLGDPIAIVGNTGENSDGPHLHFELWYHQIPVDPEKYLDFKR